MKKYLFLIVGLGLLLFAIVIVSTYNNSKEKETARSESTGNEETAATDNAKTYETAQDFTLKDLNGNEVSLSDFQGKKVFLNFWATWCPPCIAEMPEIEKLYQETKDSDLVILSVETGDSLDTVSAFIEEKGYTFEVLLDGEQSVAIDYGISAIPTSYFIDEEGTIVSKVVGGMDLDEMKNNIEKLDK